MDCGHSPDMDRGHSPNLTMSGGRSVPIPIGQGGSTMQALATQEPVKFECTCLFGASAAVGRPIHTARGTAATPLCPDDYLDIVSGLTVISPGPNLKRLRRIVRQRFRPEILQRVAPARSVKLSGIGDLRAYHEHKTHFAGGSRQFSVWIRILADHRRHGSHIWFRPAVRSRRPCLQAVRRYRQTVYLQRGLPSPSVISWLQQSNGGTRANIPMPGELIVALPRIPGCLPGRHHAAPPGG
jgi:hypothetical protein